MQSINQSSFLAILSPIPPKTKYSTRYKSNKIEVKQQKKNVGLYFGNTAYIW